MDAWRDRGRWKLFAVAPADAPCSSVQQHIVELRARVEIEAAAAADLYDRIVDEPPAPQLMLGYVAVGVVAPAARFA